MTLEVPAQVQNAPYAHNEIQVQGGTNWDFSRTAIVTDIVQLPDPKPVPAAIVPVAAAPSAVASAEEGVPSGAPALTLLYANHNAVVSHLHRAQIVALPKTQAWVVVAHADRSESDALRFAKARARAVTTLLRSSGHEVSRIKASIAPLPIAGAVVSVANNRSVSIYPIPFKAD
jgi:hypothetical protein